MLTMNYVMFTRYLFIGFYSQSNLFDSFYNTTLGRFTRVFTAAISFKRLFI